MRLHWLMNFLHVRYISKLLAKVHVKLAGRKCVYCCHKLASLICPAFILPGTAFMLGRHYLRSHAIRAIMKMLIVLHLTMRLMRFAMVAYGNRLAVGKYHFSGAGLLQISNTALCNQHRQSLAAGT